MMWTLEIKTVWLKHYPGSKIDTLGTYCQEHTFDFPRRTDASEEGDKRHDDSADQ